MTISTRTAGPIEASTPGEILLSVRNLQKHFPIKEGALQRVVGSVKAVDGVDFDLRRGETLGLVGESGCGKTTLGRCVSGLTEPTAGGVFFDLSENERDRINALLAVPQESQTEEHRAELEEMSRVHRVDRLEGERWKHYRRNCQVVFQDSFSSLNPRQFVKDIVGRPLRIHREASGSDLTDRVVDLLEQVGLGSQHLYRYPHQFSGGQRQRISIARALALDPELLVLDEPTSALDVSVQAQILNLLHELQKELGLTYLFISHDLSVVRHMADRIVVMYLGKVAEAAATGDLFERPNHPYTAALLAASPDVSDDSDVPMQPLEGSVPDPARPPQGCRFHTRCPAATPACGWELDDVVRWLQDEEGLLDGLRAVERTDEFGGSLEFTDHGSADALATALRSNRVPAAMIEALELLEVTERTVHIRFRSVAEVALTSRGPGHEAACVLDTLPDEMKS
ncbi:MAG TPA: ABC transporter ATP-binding protein [Acidimicrobiia bacterium]|nr:ABC transporter ATP-binding protein [Acidimicrobiia bacterium]